jgi:hypothetical protein
MASPKFRLVSLLTMASSLVLAASCGDSGSSLTAISVPSEESTSAATGLERSNVEACSGSAGDTRCGPFEVPDGAPPGGNAPDLVFPRPRPNPGLGPAPGLPFPVPVPVPVPQRPQRSIRLIGDNDRNDFDVLFGGPLVERNTNVSGNDRIRTTIVEDNFSDNDIFSNNDNDFVDQDGDGNVEFNRGSGNEFNRGSNNNINFDNDVFDLENGDATIDIRSRSGNEFFSNNTDNSDDDGVDIETFNPQNEIFSRNERSTVVRDNDLFSENTNNSQWFSNNDNSDRDGIDIENISDNFRNNERGSNNTFTRTNTITDNFRDNDNDGFDIEEFTNNSQRFSNNDVDNSDRDGVDIENSERGSNNTNTNNRDDDTNVTTDNDRNTTVNNNRDDDTNISTDNDRNTSVTDNFRDFDSSRNTSDNFRDFDGSRNVSDNTSNRNISDNTSNRDSNDETTIDVGERTTDIGVGERSTDIDVQVGPLKIVCTAMNQAYGFGSFRNRIWLKYAEDRLTKEHEVGYHTLFLPLVDFGFKQGDQLPNRLVRRALEHVARHRSIDLRAEMRGGQRDRLGRFYRSILEPTCYLVGKIVRFQEERKQQQEESKAHVPGQLI